MKSKKVGFGETEIDEMPLKFLLEGAPDNAYFKKIDDIDSLDCYDMPDVTVEHLNECKIITFEEYS